MKPIKFFTTYNVSRLPNPYRHILMAIVLPFVIAISVGPASSQSKDQDHPTPLTSNLISGTIGPEMVGDRYYYSFMADPGEVAITLTVETGKGVNKMEFVLFDENEVMLAMKAAQASPVFGNPAQAVQSVSVKRRQRLLVRLDLQYSSGPAKYRVYINGAVDVGQKKSILDVDISDAIRREYIKRNGIDPYCFPNRGILRVRMKDGSVRRIDLSQVEAVTVEP